MGLKEWVGLLRGQDRLVEVADRIAGDCLNSIWPKVEARIDQMPLAEARGYVRARSQVQVQRTVARVDEARGLGVDRVVSAVLDEIARLAIARSLEVPAPALVPMRRAA